MAYSESALLLQLWRTVSTMRHIDELLHWFIYTVMQRSGVQVVQLWTCPSGYADSPEAKLRTFAHQDISPPWNIFTGKPVAAAVEYIVLQRNISLPPVHNVFPVHMATLLQRYGINYCAGYGVRNDLYLPAQGMTQIASVPEKMVLLIFARRPPQRSLSEVETLLQQVLVMAERHHLVRIQQSAGVPSQHPTSATLNTLVPRRTADAASNPLTLAIAIPDKNARILYAAIDDHKPVGELANMTHLTSAEIYQALQILLEQQRIQLYEPGANGKFVDSRLFIRQGREVLQS